MPLLRVGKFIDNKDLPWKYRAFGFCYEGPRLSEHSLTKTDKVKEAYGVTVDGVNYVCVVLFRRCCSYVRDMTNLPYALGLLPSTIMANKIPGRDYHLSLYEMHVETDDPVLEMIKRPSLDKWFWSSSSKKKK
jgi:hypothetical protein